MGRRPLEVRLLSPAPAAACLAGGGRSGRADRGRCRRLAGWLGAHVEEQRASGSSSRRRERRADEPHVRRGARRGARPRVDRRPGRPARRGHVPAALHSAPSQKQLVGAERRACRAPDARGTHASGRYRGDGTRAKADGRWPGTSQGSDSTSASSGCALLHRRVAHPRPEVDERRRRARSASRPSTARASGSVERRRRAPVGREPARGRPEQDRVDRARRREEILLVGVRVAGQERRREHERRRTAELRGLLLAAGAFEARSRLRARARGSATAASDGGSAPSAPGRAARRERLGVDRRRAVLLVRPAHADRVVDVHRPERYPHDSMAGPDGRRRSSSSRKTRSS